VRTRNGELAEENAGRPVRIVRFPGGTLERVHYEPENHIFTRSGKSSLVELGSGPSSVSLLSFANWLHERLILDT
jgi:hypothetical protein